MEIKPEHVCHVIFKARAINAGNDLVDTSDDDTGVPSGPGGFDEETVDEERFEEFEHDENYIELKSFIDELAQDEQCELVALAWLGRGEDSNKDDWEDLVRLAYERHNDRTANYLLGMPMLADYLQEALQIFDVSCEDFENEHR